MCIICIRDSTLDGIIIKTVRERGNTRGCTTTEFFSPTFSKCMTSWSSE